MTLPKTHAEAVRARDDAHRLADDLRSGDLHVIDLDTDEASETNRVAELLEMLRDLLARQAP